MNNINTNGEQDGIVWSKLNHTETAEPKETTADQLEHEEQTTGETYEIIEWKRMPLKPINELPHSIQFARAYAANRNYNSQKSSSSGYYYRLVLSHRLLDRRILNPN